MGRRSRGPVRGYAPACDDLYEFAGPGVHEVAVSLSRNELQLLLPPTPAHSALLVVRVRTIAAALVPAWFELCSPQGRRVRHHLDRGARGVRFFDISGVLAPEQTSVLHLQLNARHVTFEADARVVFFSSLSSAQRRVLAIAPHPDDAEIAAFGMYKHCDSAVVTVTAGDAGGSNYRRFYADNVKNHDLKRRLRVWDSLAVPLWAGVSPNRVANLGYFDETLQAMHDAPTQTVGARATGDVALDNQRRAFEPSWLRPGATATWSSLVQDLAHIVETFRPTVIASPHPLLDAHPDHRYTTIALLEALTLRDHAGVDLYLYVNHPVYCAEWPFGPPGTDAALPPWPRMRAQLAGFYSHPLSVDDQVDKLFSLEAMHDLRRAPPSITSPRDWGVLAALWSARDAFLRHNVGEHSYLRRAIRAREMFFVYPAREAATLCDLYRDPSTLW